MDHELKTKANRFKSEKKKKKNIKKIKELENDLFKTKYANNPNKLKPALKELNKIHVVNKNLDEIKREVIVEYTGVLEMVGSLKVGDQIRQTHFTFRNVNDYEAYINAIDQDYDSEDAVFNGYIYKIDTPQFILVNRSRCENCFKFRHDLIEFRGNICFIPTKGYCFVKCLNFLCCEDYKQH